MKYKKLFLLLIATALIVCCPSMAQRFDIKTKKAEYPGGVKALDKFVAKKLQYPESSKNKSIQGTCTIGFTVQKNGKLANHQVIFSTGNEELDNEALRIVSMIKKYNPAKNWKNEAIESAASCKIRFKLENNAVDSAYVYNIYDVFPGGETAFTNYINENAVYPNGSLEHNIEYNLKLTAVLDKDGKLSNKQIAGFSGFNTRIEDLSIERGFHMEAMRLVSEMPKLAPVKDEAGNSVTAIIEIPVSFATNRNIMPMSMFEENIVSDLEKMNVNIPNDCEVTFTINTEGKTEDIKMTKSSGNDETDKKIIDIVKDLKSQPAVKSGKKVSSTVNIPIKKKTANDNTVYNIVEQQPQFPGGIKAMFNWIQDNIRYPETSKKNGSQGTALMEFTINKDGSITDVKIQKSTNDIYLDKEAERVIKSMPKWMPGKQNGKAVNVSYKLPIRFKL